MERLLPRHIIGVATGLIALGVLAGTWAAAWGSGPGLHDPVTALLTLCLLAGLALSNQFPIHIRVSSKIYMGTVVLYLMATLLPVQLAAAATILGMLVGELSVQARTGNPPSVIVTQAARWSVVVALGSGIAHLPVPPPLSDFPLLAAGVVLWTGDMLTSLLVLVPATRERPSRLVRVMVRTAGLPEAAQYLVGFMAALMARYQLWTLTLCVLPTALLYVTFKGTKEMHDETRKILESMADTVDLRDSYTGGHSRRVAELTRGILQELGKHGPEAGLIVSAARVHDIGKIGIPDEILRKPGKLTAQERALMETHAERGAELLRRYPDFGRGAEIIRHHHEAWDGSGYPHRLQGTDIPFGSRIIAVADSYDAMTSTRTYRPAMSPQAAAEVLREGRGQQWDPAIVDAFLRSVADQLAASPVPHLRLVPDTSTNLA